MPTKVGEGFLERLGKGLGLKQSKAPQAPQDNIPPGAPLYGDGPSHVQDSRPTATTSVGDPFSPRIGDPEHGQPTHDQVITETHYGDPRPIPTEAPRYWRMRDADDAKRHSVQVVDGNGWDTPVRLHPQIVPPTRPPSDRWTAYAHPELDSFIVTDRETDGARLFTGRHFSMADHRRDYRVMEQTPVKTARNTFRLEPTAWDMDYVDVPTETAPNPAGYEAQSGMLGAGGRSYRLGG